MSPQRPGGAGVVVRGLSWTPLGRRTPILHDLSLRIDPGERVLLVGASGCGKSTLLRALAGVLVDIDPGELRGDVLVDGIPARGGDGRVGLLVQDPADARVAGRVGRDVAFGLENLAVPREKIAGRVADALESVGFPYGVDHLTAALSGGEAQRLALAGVLAMRPRVLLLDEPTSMLDDASAATVRSAVVQAVEASGSTLVVVEHQLEGWVDVVDRLVVLGPDGGVVADGPVALVLAQHGQRLVDAGVWVPGFADPAPLDVPEALVTPYAGSHRPGEVLLSGTDLGLVHKARLGLSVGRRRPAPRVALGGVNARVVAGELLAVRGPSGAGKSSVVAVLAGLVAPSSGGVVACELLSGTAGPTPHRWSSPQLAERIGWVPQQAELSVVGSTVADSLLATARALGQDAGRSQTRARDLLELLGLGALAHRNPHQLSGGESRRLAMATALVHGPQVLALDEPTVGQDRHTWSAVSGLALASARAGVGVVLSTHDGVVAEHGDRTMWLDAGRVVVPAVAR